MKENEKVVTGESKVSRVSISRIVEEAIERVINLRGCSRTSAWTYIAGEIREKEETYYNQ